MAKKATTSWLIDYLKVEAEKVKELEADIYWTDASKYADQYYGETMRQTTRFDNDYWDDV